MLKKMFQPACCQEHLRIWSSAKDTRKETPEPSPLAEPNTSNYYYYYYYY